MIHTPDRPCLPDVPPQQDRVPRTEVPLADTPLARVSATAVPCREAGCADQGEPQFVRTQSPHQCVEPLAPPPRADAAATAGQVAAKGAGLKLSEESQIPGGEQVGVVKITDAADPPEDPPPVPAAGAAGPEPEPAPEAPKPSRSGGDDGGGRLPPGEAPVPSPDPEEPPDEPAQEVQPTRLSLPPLRAMREAALNKADRAASELTQAERIAIRNRTPNLPWPSRDAPLETGEHSFHSWFKDVLPSGEVSLKDYIESTLEPLNPRLAIELGGVGSRLFAGFTPGFFDATVGVSLTDLRHATFDRIETLIADDGRNHDVIEGNIIKPEAMQKVDEWLGGRKAGLIIERVFAGADTMPNDPMFLAERASDWYKRLAEGGLLLAQVPPGLLPPIEKWKEMVSAQVPQLDVQTGNYESWGLVRIHRLPGSPESLPLLSARTMMEERNAMRRLPGR